MAFIESSPSSCDARARMRCEASYLPSLTRTPLYGTLQSPTSAVPVNVFPDTTPV